MGQDANCCTSNNGCRNFADSFNLTTTREGPSRKLNQTVSHTIVITDCNEDIKEDDSDIAS